MKNRVIGKIRNIEKQDLSRKCSAWKVFRLRFWSPTPSLWLSTVGGIGRGGLGWGVDSLASE